MNGYPIKANARFALQGQPCKRRLGYRQFQVLNYINQVIAAAGIAPSYNMIADELGMEKANVAHTIVRLERRGMLKRVEKFRCQLGESSRMARAILLPKAQTNNL